MLEKAITSRFLFVEGFWVHSVLPRESLVVNVGRYCEHKGDVQDCCDPPRCLNLPAETDLMSLDGPPVLSHCW